MRSLSTLIALTGVAVLAGCGGNRDQSAADTSAAAPGTTTIPAALSLAAVAGRWRPRSISEAGDTVASYELIATADTSGWTFIVPDRPPIPVRVTIVGDSLRTEGGPFESIVRKGVQVRLTGVLRLEGDRLIGTTIAHFAGSGPDSVMRVRTEGTRQQ